jgi:integrase
MRPGEVCAIRPCDIDRSGEIWTYRPESHKTEHHDRDRVVFIGPKAQALLLRYLARDSAMYCFRPIDSEAKRRAEVHTNRKTPLSCGNRPGSNRRSKPKRTVGECYTTASYRRAIHRACDKAFSHPKLGYKLRSSFTDAEKSELREWQTSHRWSPNQLRHTAATEIRKRHGLEAAQVILGHSTADVTQVYAERDIAKGIEVARRLG